MRKNRERSWKVHAKAFFQEHREKHRSTRKPDLLVGLFVFSGFALHHYLITLHLRHPSQPFMHSGFLLQALTSPHIVERASNMFA
jgi:hypothetical protein